MVNSKHYNVTVNKKIVDATYLNTNIPLTHTPSFTRDDDVAFTPVNTVVQMIEGFDNYVVVGGGKTGIDTCLWLLENHVAPHNIHWVVSRDAWVLNRKNTQPLDDFFFDSIVSPMEKRQVLNALLIVIPH